MPDIHHPDTLLKGIVFLLEKEYSDSRIDFLRK